MTSNCSRCDKPFKEEPIKCIAHKGYICKNCIGYVDRKGNHYCFDCIDVGQSFDYYLENEKNVLR